MSDSFGALDGGSTAIYGTTRDAFHGPSMDPGKRPKRHLDIVVAFSQVVLDTTVDGILVD